MTNCEWVAVSRVVPGAGVGSLVCGVSACTDSPVTNCEWVAVSRVVPGAGVGSLVSGVGCRCCGGYRFVGDELRVGGGVPGCAGGRCRVPGVRCFGVYGFAGDELRVGGGVLRCAGDWCRVPGAGCRVPGVGCRCFAGDGSVAGRGPVPSPAGVVMVCGPCFVTDESAGRATGPCHARRGPQAPAGSTGSRSISSPANRYAPCTEGAGAAGSTGNRGISSPADRYAPCTEGAAVRSHRAGRRGAATPAGRRDRPGGG